MPEERSQILELLATDQPAEGVAVPRADSAEWFSRAVRRLLLSGGQTTTWARRRALTAFMVAGNRRTGVLVLISRIRSTLHASR